jgi:hypothetical protein
MCIKRTVFFHVAWFTGHYTNKSTPWYREPPNAFSILIILCILRPLRGPLWPKTAVAAKQSLPPTKSFKNGKLEYTHSFIYQNRRS